MIPLRMFPDLEKTAGCNMCGKCCEAIRLTVPHEHFAPSSGYRYRDADFIWENFIPMSKEEALAINPNLFEAGLDEETESYYYSCKLYDKDTKLCKAHDKRPHTCRGFPWYGNPINNHSLQMHLTCSYWLDVPVEAWPSGVDI